MEVSGFQCQQIVTNAETPKDNVEGSRWGGRQQRPGWMTRWPHGGPAGRELHIPSAWG